MITAQLVKELRDRTGISMMDCKSALVEADGDIDKAIEVLRKKSKADTDGEIVYKGKNVFLGYSNSYRDLKNKDKIKGILNTGDIGFLDKNNLIHLTGRKKRILKIFGIRISLDLLEQELQKHNYQCICNGNDKKLQIHILANTKVNLPELNKLIIEITGINKNFIETIKVKKFQRNAFGKIKYND